MCKLIASEVAFMTSEKGVIDLAIYRQGGSLRLFNCPKIGLDGCVSERSIYRLPSRADPLRYMMTSTVDTLSIITPMHLS
jgi:hypothetical protein